MAGQSLVDRNPDSADDHANQAQRYVGESRFEEAELAARRALELHPGHLDGMRQLTNALLFQGRPAEAIPGLRELHRRVPGDANIELNLGMALLSCGAYGEGWKHYEARLRTARGRKSAKGMQDYAQPRWTGESLEGKTLLLHREQGLGNTLQFLRFIPTLRERASRVILRVEQPLLCLVGESVAGIAVAPASGPIEQFDIWAPICSLGSLLRVDLGSMPGQFPYLRADTRRRAEWRARLASSGALLRVGVVWSGSSAERSLPLAALAPLASVPETTLYSLQFGPQALVAETLDDFDIITFGNSAAPFEELAALMCELDLMVTVDTAAAHVAGALGVPCWVLLTSNPDWRWLQQRSDSPWYPSVRLFRQDVRGDWFIPLAKAAQALLCLVRIRRSTASKPTALGNP